MSLSYDRIPTTTPAPELYPATPDRDAPNSRSADFPMAEDEARLAAGGVLAANSLAGFFYESLVADPATSLREVLFTAFVNDWSGFNTMLVTVDRAAASERALTHDQERVALLNGLRSGISAGKRAYQQHPTDWELDVLLGLSDAVRAPLTAEFITLAYDAERAGLARRMRDRAGEDAQLVDGVTRLTRLLDGPDSCVVDGDEGAKNGSWFDRSVDAGLELHGALVDALVDPVADVPGLGDWTKFGAENAETGAQFVGGAAKGFGDLVGGVANMARHPVDSTKELLGLAEYLPGTHLRTAHKAFDVATGHETLAEALLAPDLSEDLMSLGQAGQGLAQPFLDALALGKPAEAAGRAAFDIGSVFMGAGELRLGSRLSRLVGKFSTKAGGLAPRVARSAQMTAPAEIPATLKAAEELSTKTVWDSMDKLGPMLPDTQVPRWFEVAAGGERYWVAPNATEHFEEYLTRGGTSHGMPMNSQTLLTSFHAALEDVLAQGVRYGKKGRSGPWEIILSESRGPGQLPCVKHALYTP